LFNNLGDFGKDFFYKFFTKIAYFLGSKHGGGYTTVRASYKSLQSYHYYQLQSLNQSKYRNDVTSCRRQRVESFDRGV